MCTDLICIYASMYVCLQYHNANAVWEEDVGRKDGNGVGQGGNLDAIDIDSLGSDVLELHINVYIHVCNREKLSTQARQSSYSNRDGISKKKPE